jgi:hypothetical protein
LVADVLITNLSAAKPLIPSVEAAIGQMELLCVGSKFDAVPLTSGEVPESVQRLSRKGLPLVAAIASVPVEATRSQESSPPAAPDYAASSTDPAILRLPPKTELAPTDVDNVFGWPRDLEAHYQLGAVLGAGSFGIVRRAVHRRTGAAYAVKSIPKIPRRGPCTPRAAPSR